MAPIWHLRHQAAWQESCCNAVSKTVNLPEHATPDDVAAIYMKAHEMKCKGVTIYRNNSRNQVMNVGVNGSDGRSRPRIARRARVRSSRIYRPRHHLRR